VLCLESYKGRDLATLRQSLPAIRT
jgi:hypothetical protein